MQSILTVVFHPFLSVSEASRGGEEAPCPLGHFPCGNMSVCLPQALHCNGHNDCPNKADELLCGDNIGLADLISEKLRNRPVVSEPVTQIECFLQEYPERCDCTQTDVECVKVGLQEVPVLSPNGLFLDYTCATKNKKRTSFSAGRTILNILISTLMLLCYVHTALSNGRLTDHIQRKDHGNAIKSPPIIEHMDLEGNHIETLNYSILKTCSKLEVLLLMDNKIRRVPENTFQSLWKLAELNLSITDLYFGKAQRGASKLEGIEIPDIQTKMFLPMRNLSHIYFKVFQYCSYAPHVRSCKPNTDGISSFEDLLANMVLRVSVWVMAFITCFGNLLVIGMRSLIRAENNLHAVCIKVLCCADCLMGVYLFFVGVFDVKFRGQYNRNALQWMESVECRTIGFLAMLSSEVRSTNPHCATIWRNCLCFSLGLNLVAFLVITMSYSSMFYNIYKTGINATDLRSRLHKDVAVANRFFFIVISDALCWIPIFLVKVLSLLEVEIPGTISSWVVIFVLPINSALNPILYTLTTSFFREQVEVLLCRWQRRHTLKKDRKSLTSSTIFMETSRPPCCQPPSYLQRVSLISGDPRYA
uniref:Relaxin family peptide receptor 2a n=1 Tax=Oryzias sinensis TaxID=183150 RepID=A0A8C7ZEL6_9TELE